MYYKIIVITFPPAAVRAAKQNNVDISLFPSIWNLAKDAAWPSMGCEQLFSTEYNCIAPTTRFC